MRIGRYEVLEVVKSGKAATLFHAVDTKSNTEVALKTFRFKAGAPQAARRFQQETRTSAFLEHPNIRKALQIGFESTSAFVASEWLKGEDIGRFRAGQGFSPFDVKLEFIIGICEGLLHAHENGVFHCGISPRNIFMTISGEPKILDFGTSGFWWSDSDGAADDSGQDYRAPEQIDHRACDPRTDLYSAGLVFLEFLGGERPQSPEGSWPNPFSDCEERFEPGYADSLFRVFRKAIAGDPGDRFQSAAEFLWAIRKLLTDFQTMRKNLLEEIRKTRQAVRGSASGLGDRLESEWLKSRLLEAKVDPGILRGILADPGVEPDLTYKEACGHRDQLGALVLVLQEISAGSERLQEDVAAIRAVLAQNKTEQAFALIKAASRKYPGDPSIAALWRDLRIHAMLAAVETAMEVGDRAWAASMLSELEADTTQDEAARRPIAAARKRLAGSAIGDEALYVQTEAAISQINNAIRVGDEQRIAGLKKRLEGLEQELLAHYPASTPVTILVQRSRHARSKGVSACPPGDSPEHGESTSRMRMDLVRAEEEALSEESAGAEAVGPARPRALSETEVPPAEADVLPGRTPEGQESGTDFESLRERVAPGTAFAESAEPAAEPIRPPAARQAQALRTPEYAIPPQRVRVAPGYFIWPIIALSVVVATAWYLLVREAPGPDLKIIGTALMDARAESRNGEKSVALLEPGTEVEILAESGKETLAQEMDGLVWVKPAKDEKAKAGQIRAGGLKEVLIPSDGGFTCWHLARKFPDGSDLTATRSYVALVEDFSKRLNGRLPEDLSELSEKQIDGYIRLAGAMDKADDSRKEFARRANAWLERMPPAGRERYRGIIAEILAPPPLPPPKTSCRDVVRRLAALDRNANSSYNGDTPERSAPLYRRILNADLQPCADDPTGRKDASELKQRALKRYNNLEKRLSN